MSDTLVVAISQSGTTTDTNRTVDLARARGAHVIAIVNRRNSDLADQGRRGPVHLRRARRRDERGVDQGVLRPGGGRLPARRAPSPTWPGGGRPPAATSTDLLGALRDLPDGHGAGAGPAGADRPDRGRRLAPPRRYWAVVGNGPNRIAAAEVRIKLSELCYKSIACDATEDKKHIDLSSRAADPGVRGRPAAVRPPTTWPRRSPSTGPTRRRRWSSPPRARSASAAAVQARDRCPPTHPALAFVLSAMVGHLFGYEAALAIDAQARPLREARAAIEAAVRRRVAGRRDLLDQLGPTLEPVVGSLLRRACAPATTTATSRPARRCGWSRCCATPPGVLPLEALPGRARQGGHAERGGGGPDSRR